jgi:hypothetical protein
MRRHGELIADKSVSKVQKSCRKGYTEANVECQRNKGKGTHALRSPLSWPVSSSSGTYALARTGLPPLVRIKGLVLHWSTAVFAMLERLNSTIPVPVGVPLRSRNCVRNRNFLAARDCRRRKGGRGSVIVPVVATHYCTLNCGFKM